MDSYHAEKSGEKSRQMEKETDCPNLFKKSMNCAPNRADEGTSSDRRKEFPRMEFSDFKKRCKRNAAQIIATDSGEQENSLRQQAIGRQEVSWEHAREFLGSKKQRYHDVTTSVLFKRRRKANGGSK